MFVDFFSPTIPVRVQWLVVAVSVGVILIVIDLIQRGRLKEGYSIGWFILGLAMLLVSLYTPLLDMLARVVGISYSPAVFMLILFAGLLVLALHYSVLVTRFDRQLASLAQEQALLKYLLEKKDE